MTKVELGQDYWEDRYITQNTGWDIGYVNPIFVDYAKSKCSLDSKILIPGGGNCYEGAALWNLGYKNVFIIDIAPSCKTSFLIKNPHFPNNQFITGDFFELNIKFDYILEQTFFCAIDPSLRTVYVTKIENLLNTNGRLFGLLFSFDKKDGPPFGGSKEEYLALFSDKFSILQLAECPNSIPERQGNEYLIEFEKK